MNDLSPDSAQPPPIARLSNDILWRTFLWNADMFNPLERNLLIMKSLHRRTALSTTLQYTHVCQRWRTLLLGSPSIWGRVVRFDQIYHFREEGRAEILRRTGTAPLCLLGYIESNTAESFSLFLRENWTRVQKIHINIFAPKAKLLDLFWNTLKLDAPILERFSVVLYSSTYGIPRSTLFGNSAPFLHQVHIEHMPFNINDAHWLALLRSFTLRFSQIQAKDIMEAISRMPLLEYLSLGPETFTGHIDPFSVRSGSIHLPHLTSLHINLSPHLSLAFARVIEPAKYCALTYCWPSSTPVEEAEINQEYCTTTIEVLERYVGAFLSKPTAMTMVLGSCCMFFDLEIHRRRDKPPMLDENQERIWGDFQIRFPNAIWMPRDDTHFFQRLSESLAKYDWSTVNDLTLDLGGMIDSGEASWVRSLSRVESLRINQKDLRILTSCYAEEMEPFFPHLRALHIREVRPAYAGEANEMYLDLVSHRAKTNSSPIEVLEIEVVD